MILMKIFIVLAVYFVLYSIGVEDDLSIYSKWYMVVRRGCVFTSVAVEGFSSTDLRILAVRCSEWSSVLGGVWMCAECSVCYYDCRRIYDIVRKE